ncbi:hypothetical protein [Undibacterium sp. TJN19]|uniref:hypothetical protein n=1 Tax=Undibacterium sp. TJN19 TaxID=3413055 RepID=UPI003BF2026D
MNTQLPFGLPKEHFAQPAIESAAAPLDGQTLIDAFSDCSTEQCEKMAAMLDQGKFESAGRMLLKAMKDWSEKTV